MNLSKLKYEDYEVDEVLYQAFKDFESFTETESGKIVMKQLMRVSFVGNERNDVLSGDRIQDGQRWIRETEKILNSKPTKFEKQEGEEYE